MPARQVCAMVVSVVRVLRVRDRLVPAQARVVLLGRPHQVVQVLAQAVVLVKAVLAVQVRAQRVRSAVRAVPVQPVVLAAVRAMRPATLTVTVVRLIFPANFFRSFLLTQAGSPSL